MSEYLIFSDESGTWNSKSGYYIRSWIKITKEEYKLLKKEVEKLKQENNIKEIKWRKFSKNYKKFDSILKYDFNVFITISRPKHFFEKENVYNAVINIKRMSLNKFGGRAEIAEKIRKKIIKTVENTLFFNLYEKQHIENTKFAFTKEDGYHSFHLLVDSPQHLKKEWKKIAKEAGFEKVKIVKDSKKEAGIELSDVIAGCIQNMIKKEELATSIYNSFIKPKMVDMTSRDCPNPNLIFYNDFSSQEKSELNIFR